MSYRGHSRNRGGYNNNNGRYLGDSNFNKKVNDFNDQNKVWVEIKGWTNASQQELVSFISRKSRIALKDVEANGDTIRGSVLTQKDADYLKGLSGIRFAGNSLKIDIVGAGNAPNTVELFRSFLKRRYNPQIKLLDLTNTTGDQELRSINLFQLSYAKIFSAMLTVAADETYLSDVESVNLSENHIEDGTTIALLPQTFPFLKNLSLSANNITRLKALDSFRHKFNSLRELILVGNPIVNDPGYKEEMVKLFPRLILLDSQTIRDENKLKEIWKFPLAKSQFFFEDMQVQSIATDFIANYLNFWDLDRTKLIPLYTQDSQFSVLIDSAAPHISDAADKNNGLWGFYLPNSRNLSRTSSATDVKLGKGSEQILGLFKNLPKTKHALTTNPEHFSTDAWKVSDMVISIVLHGQFQEIGEPEVKKVLNRNTNRRGGFSYNNNNNNNNNNSSALLPRSFDRTWLLVSAGNSFVIASDLLTVRPYAGDIAWKQGEQEGPKAEIPATVSVSNISPVAIAANVNIAPEIAAKLTHQQQELLVKIMTATKLNVQFAGMLMEQSNWDINVAMQNFNLSKANIPSDAFMN